MPLASLAPHLRAHVPPELYYGTMDLRAASEAWEAAGYPSTHTVGGLSRRGPGDGWTRKPTEKHTSR